MVACHFTAIGFFGKVSQQTGNVSQQTRKVSQHPFAVKWQSTLRHEIWTWHPWYNWIVLLQQGVVLVGVQQSFLIQHWNVGKIEKFRKKRFPAIRTSSLVIKLRFLLWKISSTENQFKSGDIRVPDIGD